MKKIIPIISGFVVLVAITYVVSVKVYDAYFPNEENTVGPVFYAAVESGDAEAMSHFFTQKVKLSIGKTEGIFPKKEAKDSLRAFFEKHPVKRFEILPPGKINGAEKYNFSARFSDGHFDYQIWMKLRGERIKEMTIKKQG